MTSSTWINSGGGAWGSASNWSPNHVPVAGDTANLTDTFAGASYDVVVSDSESAGVVNIDAANVTLDVEAVSILTATTINLTAGTLRVVSGAEIVGATIIAAPGTSFQAVDGTLADTTWRGPLVLFSATQSPLLTVTGSLTLLNASGHGSGELDLTGSGAEIDFSTLTLDGQVGDAGVQINVTNPGLAGSGLSGSTFLGVTQNATLTLGSHAHLDLDGAGDVRIIDVASGGAFINDGTITAEAGSAEVNLDSFTNDGTLDVITSATINSGTVAGSFVNTGTIRVGASGRLEIGGGAADLKSLSGEVDVNGGILKLDTSFTGNGTININGGIADMFGYTGAIAFAGANGTLRIAGTSMPTTISGFASGDIVDLAGLAFAGGGSATLLAGNVLHVLENAQSFDLNLDPSQSFAGTQFTVSSDTSSGTKVTIGPLVNNPPAGTSGTITAVEDIARPFTTADFGFHDVDAGDTLHVVRIDTLPTAGTLMLGGAAVAAGQIIQASDIANLTFQAATHASGAAYATFTFSVSDDTDFAAAPSTLTIDVDPTPVSSTWTLATGGNWASSFGWSPNHVPGFSDIANLTNTFSGADYDVTVTDAEAARVVNIDAANVTLDVEAVSILTATTINLTAGTLRVVSGAEIVGATIIAAPGTSFQAVDGTLADTTWRGPLVLFSATQSPLLTVTGSLTLLNASGHGSGELDLTGSGAEIDFSTLTLDGQVGDAGVQINVTNPDLTGSTFLGVTQNAILTLGSHAHLDLEGAGDVRIVNAASGGAFVNDGTITAEAGSVEVNLDSFTNDGTLDVITSATINSGTVAGSFVNTGTIRVGASGRLEIGGGAADLKSLSGEVDVNGGILKLDTSFTGNGTIKINGGIADMFGYTGAIEFAGANGTLRIAGTSMPSATISGFASGDVIDLAGVAFGSGGSATLLSGNVLHVVENAQSFDLNLDPSQSFADKRFTVSSDIGGGTMIESVIDSPPTGTSATITTTEDIARAFTAADFGFHDPNAGDTLHAVRIDTLPTAGTLDLGGAAVAAGQIIQASDISTLDFQAAANASGAAYATFTFSVSDGDDFAATPSMLTINVNAVNDPPVVGAAVKLSSIGVNSGAHLIAQADLLANASDVDGPSLTAINLQIAKGLGALADNHDGTWTYTPKINDDTSVTFSYQVTDGIAAPVADSATLKINSAQSAPAIGSPGDDTFTAPTGNSVFDGGPGVGVDTIVFNFKLTDATVTYSGNQVIIDGPTSHTVLTGIEVFKFTDGTVINNDGSPLIDDLFYYSKYHDVWAAHVDADTHFNTVGWTEGRDPNAFFDTKGYLATYTDVKAAGVNPLTHYDQNGWHEGRDPSTAFDTGDYLSHYPDVAAVKVDPLAHFLTWGAQEGRQPLGDGVWG